MKSSTSWSCTSRKYSAMVSADRATRIRVPGGSSIWPKTRAVSWRTPISSISRSEVGALTGALTDAGEHRGAREVAGDTGDHLLDQNGLADTGTTEQTDLAALDVRGEQVDDLDAGLEDLGLALELVERRRLAVDAPLLAVATVARARRGSRPSALNTWPLTTSPTGTEIGLPVSVTGAPRTRPSVGCIETVRTRLSPRCCATSRVSVLATREA